jgi:hypothetical protein
MRNAIEEEDDDEEVSAPTTTTHPTRPGLNRSTPTRTRNRHRIRIHDLRTPHFEIR